MSTMNTARYEQFLRRLFRLVEGGVLPRMQNDVSPVINLEDPADAALLFWKGHRLASGFGSGLSAVAEFAGVSLFNPLGSGILVVVTHVVSNAVNGSFQWSFTQNRTGTVQTDLRFGDTRAAVATVPKCEIGFDSLAALPTPAIWSQRILGLEPRDYGPPIVLAPGFGLMVTLEVANSQPTVSFGWLERSAEDSELKTL